MQSLKGTGRLVRLALRRDRIKLPMWILSIIAFSLIFIPAVRSVYANDPAGQVGYATTTASSLVSRLLSGPVGGSDIGAIVNNEVFIFAAIAIAFMSSLTVMRHTRQNEETGRQEIIASSVTGRHASLAAAVIVAVGANVVLGVLMALTFIANDLPVGGSIGNAAALSSIGICFVSIAAIAAQFSESARTANGLAGIAIGVMYLTRGIGDALGHVASDGVSVVSSWPSWLLPFGWVQQIHAFTEGNWWIFGLLGAFFVVTIGIAFYLSSHRDIGHGLFPARKGPAQAAPQLLSVWGLTHRLQRGTLIGWAISVIILGSCMGIISKDYGDLMSSTPDVQTFLESLSGSGELEDVYFSAILSIFCVVISAYVIQALQRLRTEESTGHLEPVLGTSVSKPRWMLSHLLYVSVGAALLLLLFGLSLGVCFAVAADGTWSDIGRIASASLAFIPPMLVVGGIVALLFGLLPRAVIALAWSVFALCFIVGEFGEMLEIPQWAINLSPFAHIPPVPMVAINYTPIIILLALALGLFVAALALFRRRDITTA